MDSVAMSKVDRSHYVQAGHTESLLPCRQAAWLDVDCEMDV